MRLQSELEPEELELILSTVKRFAKDRLDEDTLLKFDSEDHCPEDLIREMMSPDIGLHLAFIPSAYGGLGGGAKDAFQICECVGSIDLGIATSLLGISLGIDPLRVGGTEEQRQCWMTKVAEKGWVVAYAVTEPSAGSDLGAIRCQATPVIEQGHTTAYILNGNKQFATNGGIADLYTVLAMTPKGPSFFVIEKGTPGLDPGLHEVKHGIRASNTSPLVLEDVRLPAENLIGEKEGQGLVQAQEVFGYTRVMVAAFGLACGNAALNRAWAYGQEREQGGALLRDHQAWTYKLIIPHAVALEASRAYIEQLAHQLDTEDIDLQVEGAIAKLVATESGNAAAEAAIQAHGGYGYIHGYHVEKLKRDVRITCIYEGTSEIMQQTIARDRWRLHLQSRGERYRNLAHELEKVEQKNSGCGAGYACLGYLALAEILEVCRQFRLTRNQHVLFSLGALIADVEVADAFARKAAKGDPDTSHFPLETLRAMSRVWARRASTEIARGGIDLIGSSGVLSDTLFHEFEQRIRQDKIHSNLRDQFNDFAEITRSMITNYNQ